MAIPVRTGWLLLAAFLVLYLATLGVRPLLRHDEFRYAEIPREMLVSGDYVVPRLDGLRYFEKPVLSYWLGAAAQRLLGENRFAVRLPSALATGAMALIVLGFLRRCAGSPGSGPLGAWIFLTTALVFALGTFNVPDPVLALWVTASIASYYLAHRAAGPAAQTPWLVLAGVAAGLAFLTKGFLGFLLPGLVLAPLWLTRWRDGGALRFLLLPVLAALAVVAPWAWAIHEREPDFWRYFFWEQNVRRFASADASHAQPPWFYLVLLPAILLPWSFLAPAALAGLRDLPAEGRRLALFLAGWFILPFAFFSAASGKLLTYVLPCLPPLAMLLGLGLNQRLAVPGDRLVRGGLLGLAAFFGLFLAALALNGLGLVGRQVYSPADGAAWLGVMGATAAGLAVAAWAAGRKVPQARVWLAGTSVALLYLMLPFAMPGSQRDFNMPEDFLRAQRQASPADVQLVSSGTLVRSVAWIFQRADIGLLDAGELGMGLGYPDGAARLLSPERVAALVSAEGPGRPLLILATDSDYDVLDPVLALLPAGTRTETRGRYVAVHVPAPAAGATGNQASPGI